jgi:hypothetical protein
MFSPAADISDTVWAVLTGVDITISDIPGARKIPLAGGKEGMQPLLA